MVSDNSKHSPRAYLAWHWRGKNTLVYAFGVNFIGIGLIAYGIHRTLQYLLSEQSTTLFYLDTFLFTLYWLIIFPWQAIGVIRSSEKNPGNLRNTLWILPIQAFVLFSMVAFFTGGTSLVQSGFVLYQQEDPRFTEIFFGDPDYQFSIDSTGQVLTIEGLFDNGLTQDLRQQLEQHSAVNTLHLNSAGGSIFEARGVARVIINNGLNTYTDQECSSSCTTAFIAGIQRKLSPTARLGFHQYRLDAIYSMPNQQEGLVAAQQKDLEFFRSRGIDEVFLEKVFATPHDDIWYPKHSELLAAGVIQP